MDAQPPSPTTNDSDAGVSIPAVGKRWPSFGRIHTKLFPSTRTLDSRFMNAYHDELDALHRQWEVCVFQYWESYWVRTHSVLGDQDPNVPPPTEDLSPAQSQLLKPFYVFKDLLDRFSIRGWDIQQLWKYTELKGCQRKAMYCKRKIDFKYRRQLGLRNCKTIPEDFPTDLDELASYWDMWYVTESQPAPYMKPRFGGGYIVNEYYSSDDQLRLRKVRQVGATETVTTCSKPDRFDGLDVTTLYVLGPESQPCRCW
ncbi:hypothetical protein AAE478_003125 [Parahypoxylon ruwenzoriense]